MFNDIKTNKYREDENIDFSNLYGSNVIFGKSEFRKRKEKERMKRNFILSMIIIFILATAYFFVSFKIEVKPIKNDPVQIQVERQKTTIEMFKDTFGNDEKMLAIALAESGLDIKSINYNCYYKGDIVYTYKAKGSKSLQCKKGHEKYAWSRDISIFQINDKLHNVSLNDTVEKHFEVASEIKKSSGYEAWRAYTNGSYKQYLAEASNLLN